MIAILFFENVLALVDYVAGLPMSMDCFGCTECRLETLPGADRDPSAAKPHPSPPVDAVILWDELPGSADRKSVITRRSSSG